MAGQFETPLGRLVMNFGALEFDLLAAIASILGPDPKIGRVVAGPLNFQNRLRVFDALVRARLDANSPLLAKLETIISVLDQLSKRRNAMVHAPWFDVQDTNIDQVKSIFRSTLKMGVGLNEALVPTTPAEIEEISAAVFAASQDFRKLMVELYRLDLVYDHAALDLDDQVTAASPPFNFTRSEMGGNSAAQSYNVVTPPAQLADPEIKRFQFRPNA